MRTAYRTVAWVIAGLVLLQAATHAWSSAGAAKFIEGGGSLDAIDPSGPLPFVEIWGIIIHTVSGMYVIPVLAITLVVVGYFSHVQGALGYALTVAGLVAAQVAFGMMAPSLTFLAFLHGMNALLLFVATLLAIYHTRTREADPSSGSTAAVTPDAAARPRMRRRRRAVGSGDAVVGSGA